MLSPLPEIAVTIFQISNLENNLVQSNFFDMEMYIEY